MFSANGWVWCNKTIFWNHIIAKYCGRSVRYCGIRQDAIAIGCAAFASSSSTCHRKFARNVCSGVQMTGNWKLSKIARQVTDGAAIGRYPRNGRQKYHNGVRRWGWMVLVRVSSRAHAKYGLTTALQSAIRELSRVLTIHKSRISPSCSAIYVSLTCASSKLSFPANVADFLLADYAAVPSRTLYGAIGSVRQLLYCSNCTMLTYVDCLQTLFLQHLLPDMVCQLIIITDLVAAIKYLEDEVFSNTYCARVGSVSHPLGNERPWCQFSKRDQLGRATGTCKYLRKITQCFRVHWSVRLHLGWLLTSSSQLSTSPYVQVTPSALTMYSSPVWVFIFFC